MGIKAWFAFLFFVMSLLSLGTFSVFIFKQLESKLIANAQQALELHLEHEWEHFDFEMNASPVTHSAHLKDIYQRFWKNGLLFYDSFPAEFKNTDVNSGVRENAIVYRLRKMHQGDQFDLLGYYDLAGTQNYLRLLRNILIAACALWAALLIPLTLLLARHLLLPFSNLAQRTFELHAKSLSFRFPLPRYKDEYGKLVLSFNDLLERLEHSFRQLKLFASNASHELRTPISAIISQAEMHLRKHPEELAVDSPVNRILSQAKRLSKIISGLLFLSELERSEKCASHAPVTLSSFLAEIISIFKPRFHQQGKILNISLDPNEKSVDTNIELISTAFSNIVDNALKFSNKRVEISTHTVTDGIILRIEDDGAGIPSTHIQGLLAPFAKSKVLLDGEKNDGYGLGLAITSSCVEALNSTLNFGKSNLGGLCVEIKLPYSSAVTRSVLHESQERDDYKQRDLDS